MITTATVYGMGYYAGAGGQAKPGVDAEAKGATSYYTGASAQGEPPGRWSGRLADEMGLTGDVRDADMTQVFETFTAPDGTPIGNAPRSYPSVSDRIEAALAAEPDALPERIEEIREQVARSTRETVIGMDLTFSVPKSVTVAHTAAWRAEVDATRSGELEVADRFRSIRESIEGAIGEANQAAIEYAGTLATARAGTHGGGHAGRWVGVEDVAVASFAQRTSRADDPQLHTHNVVLNRARCEDGAIRAIDTVDLRKQRHAYSAMGDRVLAERLADLGLLMETRPDGMSREIVGVDEEVLDLFSQRRTTIARALEPAIATAEERLGRELNDLERNRLAQAINLATRQGKDKGDIDFNELLDSWERRIVAELGQGLAPVADTVATAFAAGPTRRDASFSPSAIGAEAIQAVAEKSAAWSRPDLVLEVERRLPLMGLSTKDSVALVDKITDETLAGFGVVQVSGHEVLPPPEDLVVGKYVAPSARLYAAPVTLEAEDLIRRAAVERRGTKLAAAVVEAWLDEHMPDLGQDQRAAVVGIATSDAALAQLIGPAGTGKSYTAGALAGVWGTHAGGTVHGLTVSQVAAEVLRNDGVLTAANIAAWRTSQDRIEQGRPMPHDLANMIGPRDIVLVDEASMVGTADLDRVRALVERAGARMVLMGDPQQLGAIGAGGAMDLVADRAETYTLVDVRRFSEAWEKAASLDLREGKTDALREYDRRGRLVEAATMDEAVAAVARAAAADRISGRSVSVTADTNDAAAQVAMAVRDHLIDAGLVEAGGVPLARTGGLAGIGDQIMTRQIDHKLGVLNGGRWDVVGWGEDGSLSVLGEDGEVRELPADYVAEHVQLAYAATVHASQGRTVDVGYTVTDGRTEAAGLYVGITRGRERNTAFVALTAAEPETGVLEHETAKGRLEAQAAGERPTARSVLADALERESDAKAARIEQEQDALRRAHMGTLLGLIEDATQLATRTRMEGDLDRFVEEGVLSPSDRARLAADQSSEHLSRLLRASEQAGMDPAGLLWEAIEGRDFKGLKSLAQGISARITSAHDVEKAAAGRVQPQRLPAEHADYLAGLQQRAAEHAGELGAKVADEAPAWATKAFGPVPEDPGARLEWETRAGAVAGYREAAGHEDAERAIGSAPGLTSTEKRAAWWGAWEALGRPEETRPEAALSDGALRARASAWAREQMWAPPHADASLRQAELDAEQARREAILAEAREDAEAAQRLRDEAEARGEVARGMAAVAEARERWAAETAVTQDLAERAREEMQARGLEPGEEDDRVSAQEWLALHQEMVEAEDETRLVTEHDVPVEQLDVDAEAEAKATAEENPQVRDVMAAEPELSESNNLTRGEPDSEPEVEVEAKPEPEVDPEPERSPAHDVASEEPDDLELEALVKRATDAENTVRDRESEEAAHDTWEVEPEAMVETADEDAYEVAEVG